MNSELLEDIDLHLSQSVPEELRTIFAGRVQQIYDPQARRPTLMRLDNAGKPVRYTIDTVNCDVQVAHLLTGGQPIKNPAQFGSRTKVAFNLHWSLICATKRSDVLSAFLLAFGNMQDVEVLDFSTDTLNVLKRDFLFSPDPKTPYDPMLQCFAIRYRMLNVSESIFSTISNFSL